MNTTTVKRCAEIPPASEYYRAFGERLYAIRQALGMSEVGAATLFHVKVATYRGWEAGRKPGVSHSRFATYASMCSIEFGYLLEGSGPMFRRDTLRIVRNRSAKQMREGAPA